MLWFFIPFISCKDDYMSVHHANKDALQWASPEVKSCCDALVGDSGIQASELVLWITVRGAFVKVTVPLYHNANSATLTKQWKHAYSKIFIFIHVFKFGYLYAFH